MDQEEARFEFLAEVQTLMARLSDPTVTFEPRSPVFGISSAMFPPDASNASALLHGSIRPGSR